MTTLLRRIETRLGSLVACWTQAGLYSFEFEKQPGQDPPVVSLTGPTTESLTSAGRFDRTEVTRLHEGLVSSVAEYFETGELLFSFENLDLSGVTEFHASVLRLCAEIEPGKTVTYGELASRAGRPGAARAVGGAMAKNRWPLLIPCHRVVGASGKLTGYSGTGGVDTKAWLLEHERVAKTMKTGLLAL